MSTFALWKLFHKHGRHNAISDHTAVLAIIAFAAATAIFLTVLGGVHGFIWRASADHTVHCLVQTSTCAAGSSTTDYWQSVNASGSDHVISDGVDTGLSWAEMMAEDAQSYVGLALIACLLLLVPFVALAGSAARLATSRRDQRLASLRLAGATQGQVIRLAAFESAGQALIGSLIGILGYCLIMPIIMLLNFQSQHFTFEQLWVGIPVLILTVLGVTALALVSALMTLRRVTVTPLGVTSRVAQPLPSKTRAIIFVGSIIAAFVVFNSLGQVSQFFGQIGALVVIVIMLALPLALLNLVGSWLVTRGATKKSKHPKDAATMIAMRRILDNPKRAWRNVSGIALAVFIAGITSLTGFIGSIDQSAVAANDPSAIYSRDISTGGLLTLAFAAVLAAVSCGIMQAGSVYDQANEYRMLVLEGTDVKTLNRARFLEVMTPLKTTVLVSAICAMILMLPMFYMVIFAGKTLLVFVLCIAACFALVAVGAFASNRVAASLNLTSYRADD